MFSQECLRSGDGENLCQSRDIEPQLKDLNEHHRCSVTIQTRGCRTLLYRSFSTSLMLVEITTLGGRPCPISSMCISGVSRIIPAKFAFDQIGDLILRQDRMA